MSLALTLICALILLFGAFVGFIRRPRNTIVRLVTLLLAAIGAFFGAKPLAKMLGGVLTDNLSDTLGSSGELVNSLLGSEAFADSVELVVQMLLAPIAFLLLYIVLKVLTLILYKIICVMLGKREKSGCLMRVVGALIGALCGLIGVIVLITPVCGYLTLADTMLGAVMSEEDRAAMPAETAEIFDLADAPLAGGLYDLVGDKLFAELTSAKWNGEKISLMSEVQGVLNFVDHIRTLGDTGVDQYGETQLEAMNALAEDVDNSYLLSHLGAGMLSGASNAWLESGEFMGMTRPQMGENVDGLLGGFLTVFSTATAENIGEDLDCFADVFGLFVNHDLFAKLGEGSDIGGFVTTLVSGGAVSELYDVLDAHPRMKPVKDAIADTGMRVMMQSLGLPEDLRESHGALLEDMSAVIKLAADENGNIDKNKLQAELGTTLQAHNVQVSDEATQLIADGFIGEFTPEEVTTLSQDEMVDRLAVRFHAA